MATRGPSRVLFDLWSQTYDNPVVQAVTYRPVQDAVVAALGPGSAGRVVDVGCGTGMLAARLAGRGWQVVGCDYSRGMLEAAARRSRRPGWVEADATRLPLAPASADALVCTESFHWYPDQGAALREFARVLRPGGRAYVALVNPSSAAISDWTHRWSRRFGQPFRWPTTAAMRAMVAASGLRVVAQRRVRRLPAGPLLPPVLTVAEKP